MIVFNWARQPGEEWRALTSAAIIVMLVFLVLAFHHVYRYARKVQQDPSKSLVAHVDYSTGFEAPQDVRLTGKRIAVLLAQRPLTLNG